MPEAMLNNMKVHRLVVDESHLLSEGSTGSKLSSLLKIKAKHVWLVSGTPFSTSLDQLNQQVRLLGMVNAWHTGLNPSRSYTTNEAVVAWLRARMIRHMKQQRIGLQRDSNSQSPDPARPACRSGD